MNPMLAQRIQTLQAAQGAPRVAGPGGTNGPHGLPPQWDLRRWQVIRDRAAAQRLLGKAQGREGGFPTPGYYPTLPLAAPARALPSNRTIGYPT